jgi:FkbM family methyltransferase
MAHGLQSHLPSAFIMNILKKFRGLKRRLGFLQKKVIIRLRSAFKPCPYWLSYPGIYLPFYNDGDLQEIHYHLNFTEWWQGEETLLSHYVKSGDVVLDIGANIGFMAGILRKIVGQDGIVHCFEPAPATYQKLCAVIKRNQWSNVVAHNMGCGSSEAVLTLHCARSSGSSSLVPTSSRPGATGPFVDVRVAPLDAYFADGLPRCDFLKIDTEGFEDQVLTGASHLLRKFQPIIYIELSIQYKEASLAAIKILSDLNYIFIREPVIEEIKYPENFIALPRNRQPNEPISTGGIRPIAN